MSVVQLLYSALETGNWENVSEAYFLLSGERIDTPKEPEVINFDTLKDVVDRLEQLEKQKKPAEKTRRGRPKKKPVDQSNNGSDNEDFLVKPRTSKSKRERASVKNKFESMTGVLEEAEQEKGIDKIDDSKYTPKNKRKAFTAKNVTCSECNTASEVHPLFARDNYICDKCLSRRI